MYAVLSALHVLTPSFSSQPCEAQLLPSFYRGGN